MEKTNKASVSRVSTISSFVMLFGTFGLVFLLAFIESITVDWYPEIWGVIFILLTFGFSFIYITCQKILGRAEKEKSEEPENNNN